MMSCFADLMNFQYFIEVVPTEVWGLTGRKTTYQYSVKEHSRPVDHGAGQHGTPGVYFKYDISALKVEVTTDREHLVQFLVRLCAGVGGLVATSQLLCGLVKHLVSLLCCPAPATTKAALHTPAPAPRHRAAQLLAWWRPRTAPRRTPPRGAAGPPRTPRSTAPGRVIASW